MSEDCPNEVINLPTFLPAGGSPYSSPYDKALYIEVREMLCRRCKGEKVDPDGDYPCLLCKGSGKEPSLDGTKRYCSRHTDKELVRIGKRRVSWEDSQGFDHTGYIEVKGCPVCKMAAYSETTVA